MEESKGESSCQVNKSSEKNGGILAKGCQGMRVRTCCDIIRRSSIK